MIQSCIYNSNKEEGRGRAGKKQIMQFIHISQFTIQDESGLKGRKLVELQKTQMKGGGSNRHEYLS